MSFNHFVQKLVQKWLMKYHKIWSRESNLKFCHQIICAINKSTIENMLICSINKLTFVTKLNYILGCKIIYIVLQGMSESFKNIF